MRYCVKLYLQSFGIKVEVFQEAATLNVATVTFGRVDIFVKKNDAIKARKLLKEYKEKIENL